MRDPEGLLGGGFRFGADYRVDAGSVRVTVEAGYGGVLWNADYQTVTLDDSRVDFTVQAEVHAGQVVHIRFDARRPGTGTLDQKDLRHSGIVPAIRRWAAVARELQIGGVGPGGPGEGTDVDWSIAIDETASIEAAINRTREVFQRWAQSQPSAAGRVTGTQAEDLMRRVTTRYKELVDAGHRAPRQIIATEENYTPEHIGRLLVKARKQGILPRARPGVAGFVEEGDVSGGKS